MINILPNNKTLRKVLFYGALVRFFFFFVVIYFQDWIDPYLLADDVDYELRVQWYLRTANGYFDWNTAENLRQSMLIQQFWNYFICFTAKILNTVYAARIFNCIFSILIIYEIFKLTIYISNDKEAAIKAAKIYAYFPYAWIFCVFPFKDVLLSLSVFCILLLFVKLQNNIKVSPLHILISIILAFCIYYLRGGVVEFIALIFILFFTDKFIKRREYGYIIILVICSILVFANMGTFIEEAAMQKISDYNTTESISSGNLAMIQIKSFEEIWKLPFTYVFAMMSPGVINVGTNESIDWYVIYCYSNVMLLPLALGGFAYVFCKKHNTVFWTTSFLMYAAVIALSIQSFRHYFFLFPVTVINYALVRSFHSNIINKFIIWGSIVFFLLIFIYKLR